MSDIERTSEAMARRIRVMLGSRNNVDKSLHELITGLVQAADELEAEVKHLKNSLGLCHYYAGCDEFVCELDGDMCTGQRVRPIESLIPPPPEAKQ